MMSEVIAKGSAVGVYIVDKERRKVLLTQRGPEARNEHGSWEGVGGAVEGKETDIQAAVREVREEIGVHVVLLCTLSEHESVEDKNGDTWHVKRYIASMSGTPVIQDPLKTQGIEWFEAKELDDLEIASYLRPDVPLLQRYLSGEHITG